MMEDMDTLIALYGVAAVTGAWALWCWWNAFWACREIYLNNKKKKNADL